MLLKKVTALLLSGLILLGVTGCKESESKKEYPITVLNTEFEQSPKKVVSLSPTITKMIDQLGLTAQLVGISTFCEDKFENPPSAEVAKLGSPVNPDIDAIIKLAPEYVLTSTPMPNWMTIKLEQSNIKIINVPTPLFIYDIIGTAKDLSIALKGLQTGTQIYQEKMQKIDDMLKHTALEFMYQEKISAVYLLNSKFNAFTGNTLGNDLFSLIGFKNAAGDIKDYNYSKERLVKDNPDVIFIADDMNKEKFCEEFKDLNAVKNGKVYVFNKLMIEKSGIDALNELERIGRALYPEQYSKIDDKIKELNAQREAQAIEDAKKWYTKLYEKIFKKKK